MASHVTAALLHELPAGGSGIHVTVEAGRRPRLTGVTIHRTRRLARADWIFKRGIPVTSVARTLIDLAGDLRPERLEDVLDHALAARKVSLKEVSYRLRTMGGRGRPGISVLAGLLAVRLAGSPRPRERGERLLEGILEEHKLPLGEREYEIALPDGRIRRPDRAYPAQRLAIQVDSFRHHSSLWDWSADLTRDNDLVAIGWRSLVVTYHDLKTRPGRVAATIEQSLRAPLPLR